MDFAIYKDRSEAGRKLASYLESYKNQPSAIIIGLPRGGVITAYHVALHLNLELEIITPRKLRAPDQEEFAIGAVCEGEITLDHDAVQQLNITEHHLKEEIEKQTKNSQEIYKLLKKDKTPIDVTNRVVILIDDGMATGSTMRAAVEAIRNKGPKKIIVAIPVAPPETIVAFKKEVDGVICPHVPDFFLSVGQFYEDFAPVEDDELLFLLQNPTKQ